MRSIPSRITTCALLFLFACDKGAPSGAGEAREPSQKTATDPNPREPKAQPTATSSVPSGTSQTPPATTKPTEGAAMGANAVPGKTGIAGVVKFDGTPPPPKKIDMSKDIACLKENPNPVVKDVDVADGKLKNVFVYVKSGLPEGQAFPPKTEPVLLDQKGCAYSPTMIGIQVGQPLKIVNSDPFLHNVHALAKGAEFNQGMPKQGQTIEKRMKKGQVPIPVKCEVHAWMQAWIGAVDHPFFAVTDEKGAFSIEGLPKGSYELELFHPTLGTQNMTVAVNDGAQTSVEATFKSL